MSEVCAVCGGPMPPERRPLTLDSDGLPLAVSMREGLGLPVATYPLMLKVFVDGIEQKECIAFDRSGCFIWRNQFVEGRPVVRDNELVVEKVSGVVTVEPVE